MKEKSLEGISVMVGMASWGPRGEVAVERGGERTRWAGSGTMVAVLEARGLGDGQTVLHSIPPSYMAGE